MAAIGSSIKRHLPWCISHCVKELVTVDITPDRVDIFAFLSKEIEYIVDLRLIKDTQLTLCVIDITAAGACLIHFSDLLPKCLVLLLILTLLWTASARSF